MSKSSHLRAQDLRNLFRITGECRDLGDDAVAWRRHWYASLAPMVRAELAGGGEILVAGGRTQMIPGVDWGWENGFDRAAYLAVASQAGSDLSAVELHLAYFAHPAGASGAGCLSRTDLMADRTWYRSMQYATMHDPIRVDHTLLCFRIVPGVPGLWNGGVFNRPKGVQRDFTSRHRRLIEESFAQLTPLLGGPLARHTAPSPAGLPPRVRQVLRCLLEGDGDKQVARRLGISSYTVNQYTKQIYRHFRVAGRAELLALWIRRGYPNGFAWAPG